MESTHESYCSKYCTVCTLRVAGCCTSTTPCHEEHQRSCFEDLRLGVSNTPCHSTTAKPFQLTILPAVPAGRSLLLRTAGGCLLELRGNLQASSHRATATNTLPNAILIQNSDKSFKSRYVSFISRPNLKPGHEYSGIPRAGD